MNEKEKEMDSNLRSIAHTTNTPLIHCMTLGKELPKPATKQNPKTGENNDAQNKNQSQSTRPHPNPHAQIPTPQPPKLPTTNVCQTAPDGKEKEKEAQATTHDTATPCDQPTARRIAEAENVSAYRWQRTNQRRAPSTAQSKMRGRKDVSGSLHLHLHLIWIWGEPRSDPEIQVEDLQSRTYLPRQV